MNERLMAHVQAGCLCKGIKLIRLIQAIDNGATSFEAIKAATGIGTGSCRGKRCGVKVRELLAQKRCPDPTRADHVACPLDIFPFNDKKNDSGLPTSRVIRCGSQTHEKRSP